MKPEDKPSLTENQRQAQLGSQALGNSREGFDY